MIKQKPTFLSVLPLLAVVAACGGSPSSGPSPERPRSYAILPDTLVCVVDRSNPAGLRELAAKKDGEDVVVLNGSEVVALSVAHPVNIIAGYAGAEGWVRGGEPISHGGQRYAHIGGERRVAIDLLVRLGESRGVLLFGGSDDEPPPDALYVPTAPGCIFQAYVREDLIRR